MAYRDELKEQAEFGLGPPGDGRTRQRARVKRKVDLLFLFDRTLNLCFP